MSPLGTKRPCQERPLSRRRNDCFGQGRMSEKGESTRWQLAAFRSRNSIDRFPAINLKERAVASRPMD